MPNDDPTDDPNALIGAATARAPSHLSAFFVPGPVERDPMRRGSSGAGLCLERGVEANVEVRRADEADIRVTRSPEEGPARATVQACRLLTKGSSLDIRVEVSEEVPVAQGFGVSGASALAAAMALAKAVGLARSDAVIAAHTAEVQARTGLGDVAAQTLGGAVLRTAPGLPPYGQSARVPAGGEVVVCVVGDPVDTKDVLSDRQRMGRVQKIGAECLEYVRANPSVQSIFDAGIHFARETAIAPDDAVEAAAACEGLGVASVAMIGSTVYAYGDTDALMETLEAWGEVGVSPIAEDGARVVAHSG